MLKNAAEASRRTNKRLTATKQFSEGWLKEVALPQILRDIAEMADNGHNTDAINIECSNQERRFLYAALGQMGFTVDADLHTVSWPRDPEL